MSWQRPFVYIHEFDGSDQENLDDDGDPRNGWYFQLMQDEQTALSHLTGPYLDGTECEAAAIAEWNSI